LTGGEGGQHPGLQQRRLAGAGRAEDHYPTLVRDQARHDVLYGGGPPVEPVGVLGGEGFQPPVRAGIRPGHPPLRGP
jgi:hypothetical protein